MELYDIIVDSSTAALKRQQSDGVMPAGHNGPYHDDETPVRNTSHWALSFLKSYEVTQRQEYLDGAEKCMGYLTGRDARPMGATFWHRKNPTKDFCNGLVGQAWTIEALVALARQFNQPQLVELASEVFLLHPFDYHFGAWKKVNVDGSYGPFDETLNHQIWFAAAGALINQHDPSPEIDRLVTDFLDLLDQSIDLYPDGLIKHKSPTYLARNSKVKVVNWLRMKKAGAKQAQYLRMKSVGYHPFNLYGLALLKKVYPEHRFWKSTKMGLMINLVSSEAFKHDIFKSKYGFPYNPPGIEIAFALQEFAPDRNEEIEQWVSTQIKECFDFEHQLMTSGGTPDPHTSAARIYEATRLANRKLNL